MITEGERLRCWINILPHQHMETRKIQGTACTNAHLIPCNFSGQNIFKVSKVSIQSIKVTPYYPIFSLLSVEWSFTGCQLSKWLQTLTRGYRSQQVRNIVFYSEKFGILEKKWQKPEMKIATEFDSTTAHNEHKKQHFQIIRDKQAC